MLALKQCRNKELPVSIKIVKKKHIDIVSKQHANTKMTQQYIFILINDLYCFILDKLPL